MISALTEKLAKIALMWMNLLYRRCCYIHVMTPQLDRKCVVFHKILIVRGKECHKSHTHKSEQQQLAVNCSNNIDSVTVTKRRMTMRLFSHNVIFSYLTARPLFFSTEPESAQDEKATGNGQG